MSTASLGAGARLTSGIDFVASCQARMSEDKGIACAKSTALLCNACGIEGSALFTPDILRRARR